MNRRRRAGIALSMSFDYCLLTETRNLEKLNFAYPQLLQANQYLISYLIGILKVIQMNPHSISKAIYPIQPLHDSRPSRRDLLILLSAERLLHSELSLDTLT